MERFKTDKMKVPAFVFGKIENFEATCLEQLEDISSLSYCERHNVLLPDGHTGTGMPVGGVLSCVADKVVPNAVGKDIGCGVILLKTNLRGVLSKSDIKKVFDEVRENVPVGFNKHKTAVQWDGFEDYPSDIITKGQIETAKLQLGTLGSGNHFIELLKDEENYIYIMVHSGSRRLGYTIAEEYGKKAEQACNQWYGEIPLSRDGESLAFLSLHFEEGRQYLRAMQYACEFAKKNRSRIALNVFKCIKNHICENLNVVDRLDIHHNYACIEQHYNQNLMIHRKGARRVRENEFVIIPGSLGTLSYIVKGKGNKKSFFSCSHGAGRTMSRRDAKEKINLESTIQLLSHLDIVHGITSKDKLDESPEAYKDINQVIKDQEELISVVSVLKPIGTIKG
jgi:tRNA-splicing ligase RtcB